VANEPVPVHERAKEETATAVIEVETPQRETCAPAGARGSRECTKKKRQEAPDEQKEESGGA
jgi:hypothetical protein